MFKHKEFCILLVPEVRKIMNMREPEIHLSKIDKELLKTIAKLLLDSSNKNKESNISHGLIVLSEREAQKLLNLIEEFLKQQSVLATSQFIDSLSSDKELYNENIAKELLLSGRKKRGRKRINNKYRWEEFLLRIGLKSQDRLQLGGKSSEIKPMDYTHFLNMEEKLFTKLNIHPRIQNILLEIIQLQESKILSRQPTRVRAIEDIFKNVVSLLKYEKTFAFESINACAALTLIANYSVLWTTRDWTVTGTISCMTAAHMSLFQK